MYPYAPLASHVVGYMGALTKDNVDDVHGPRLQPQRARRRVRRRAEHGEVAARQLGQAGVGDRRVRQHRPPARASAPVAGKDIQLSIDLDVQQYAEQALETAARNRRDLPTVEEAGRPAAQRRSTRRATTPSVCTRAQASSSTSRVRAVQGAGRLGRGAQPLQRPGRRDGELPDVRQPLVQLGHRQGEVRPAVPAVATIPTDSILVNRAVQGRYNLGSSIKPFIAWSAMHSGIIGPTSLQRRGHLQADDGRRGDVRERCALRVQERDRPVRRAEPLRPGHGRGRAGGQLRRVLLPTGRAVLHDAGQARRAEVRPRAVRLRRRQRHRPAVRVGRPDPRRRDQEGPRRPRRPRQGRGADDSSPATTCRWRSARA